MDGLDATGDYVKLTNFPNASRIKIRYASPNTGTFGLYVNNTRVASIPITATAPPPDGWNTYREQAVNVAIPLNADVTFQHDAVDVAINLDCVVVGLIEMEEGQLSSGVSVQPDYYASAGKYVFGLFDNTRSVSFPQTPQIPGFPAVDQFALRYSSFYSNSTINLYINNGFSQTITLPNLPFGGGTYGYGYKDVDASLPAGATVKFQFDPGTNTGGAVYDCIILARKSEAETATLNGCQVVPDPYASPYGSYGYRVDYIAPGDYVRFDSVRSGTRLAFRYALCPAQNGPQYGLMSLYINGQSPPTRVFFRSTGSSPCTGDLFKDKIIPVDIHSGDIVKLQYDTGDSPVKLDYIRIY